MKKLYCSYFDHRYLARALAMYESLKSFEKEASFVFLALDEKAERVLKHLNLKDVLISNLDEFVAASGLETIRNERPWNEFCFTCTPYLIDYCLNKTGCDLCIYVDADLYFFADPRVLLAEFKDEASVLMTEHRYSKGQDQTESSGRFCVQFLPFRSTSKAQEILERWKKQCFESCAYDEEKKTCGDQKYLDEWPSLFPTTQILNHNGAVGPWNIESFAIRQSGSDIYITAKEVLVFFHFHAFKFFSNGNMELTGSRYKITTDVYELIYLPYVEKLISINFSLKKIEDGNYLGVSDRKIFRHPLKEWVRKYFLRSENYIRSMID